MTSHGELLQPGLNGGDTLFQLISTIPEVRRPNATSKSRIGSSTLTPQFHLSLIQVQKMRIKDFLIRHDKI